MLADKIMNTNEPTKNVQIWEWIDSKLYWSAIQSYVTEGHNYWVNLAEDDEGHAQFHKDIETVATKPSSDSTHREAAGRLVTHPELDKHVKKWGGYLHREGQLKTHRQDAHDDVRSHAAEHLHKIAKDFHEAAKSGQKRSPGEFAAYMSRPMRTHALNTVRGQAQRAKHAPTSLQAMAGKKDDGSDVEPSKSMGSQQARMRARRKLGRDPWISGSPEIQKTLAHAEKDPEKREKRVKEIDKGVAQSKKEREKLIKDVRAKAAKTAEKMKSKRSKPHASVISGMRTALSNLSNLPAMKSGARGISTTSAAKKLLSAPGAEKAKSVSDVAKKLELGHSQAARVSAGERHEPQVMEKGAPKGKKGSADTGKASGKMVGSPLRKLLSRESGQEKAELRKQVPSALGSALHRHYPKSGEGVTPEERHKNKGIHRVMGRLITKMKANPQHDAATHIRDIVKTQDIQKHLGLRVPQLKGAENARTALSKVFDKLKSDPEVSKLHHKLKGGDVERKPTASIGDIEHQKKQKELAKTREKVEKGLSSVRKQKRDKEGMPTTPPTPKAVSKSTELSPLYKRELAGGKKSAEIKQKQKERLEKMRSSGQNKGIAKQAAQEILKLGQPKAKGTSIKPMKSGLHVAGLEKDDEHSTVAKKLTPKEYKERRAEMKAKGLPVLPLKPGEEESVGTLYGKVFVESNATSLYDLVVGQ